MIDFKKYKVRNLPSPTGEPNSIYFVESSGNSVKQYITDITGNYHIVSVDTEVPQELLDSVSSLEQQGWVYFLNTTHTEQNPFVVTSDVEFDFPLINSSSLVSNAPTQLLDFISNNKMNPYNEGDVLELRVEFTLKTDFANRQGKFDMDIGLVQRFNPLYFTGSTDASIPKLLTVDFAMFIGSTFIVNGGTLKCIIDGNADIYDIKYFLRKTFNGKDIS